MNSPVPAAMTLTAMKITFFSGVETIMMGPISQMPPSLYRPAAERPAATLFRTQIILPTAMACLNGVLAATQTLLMVWLAACIQQTIK
jgi:hypothetical protein